MRRVRSSCVSLQVMAAAFALLVSTGLPARAADPTAVGTATSSPGGGVVTDAARADQLAAARRLLVLDQPADAATALEPLAAADWPCRDLAWILLGRARLATGDTAGAIESASAARTVPGTTRLADAAWLTAEALAKGKAAGAAAEYRAFATRWPDDPRTAESAPREAEALEAAGLASEAATAWRRAALQVPDVAPADAMDRARRLARAAHVALPPPTKADLLRVAQRLTQANLQERAAVAWGAVERVSAGEAAATAAVSRARSLYALRENGSARHACEDALRRFPASVTAAECHLVIARVASRMGDQATLQRQAKVALADRRWRKAPWRADLAMLHAGTLADDGHWTEAAAAYQRIASETTGDRSTEASWKAAWSLLRAGRAADAAPSLGALAQRQGLDTEVGRNATLWRGIALERQGDAGAAAPSDVLAGLYRDCPWTYHGQRARELLAERVPADALAALDGEAQASGVAFEDPGPATLADPSGSRYVLLRDAGLHEDALPEIEALRKGSGDSKAFLFELARARARAGQSSDAQALLVRVFPEAVHHPSRRSPAAFWEVVYPRPQGEMVDRLAANAGIDAAFCSAIIRAESAWRPDVRSVADARGLMQLVPATATRMAGRSGLDGFVPDQLFDPEVNVRLGSRYLADLLDLFGGDEAAAAASYNAGEDKVAKWWADLDAEGVTSLAERVERIPYRETRVYVKRVLEATGWYRWLANCDAGAISSSPGEPPHAEGVVQTRPAGTRDGG